MLLAAILVGAQRLAPPPVEIGADPQVRLAGGEDMSAVVTAIRGADPARAWPRTASVHQESAVDQTGRVTRIICPTTIVVVP
jgi:hypothetical protein